jgi:hypothetical protein
MHHLSNRDLGDEQHVRDTDWATVRDAVGRIVHITPATSTTRPVRPDPTYRNTSQCLYTFSSDDYHHDHIYPHGDGTDERNESGVTHGKVRP